MSCSSEISNKAVLFPCLLWHGEGVCFHHGLPLLNHPAIWYFHGHLAIFLLRLLPPTIPRTSQRSERAIGWKKGLSFVIVDLLHQKANFRQEARHLSIKMFDFIFSLCFDFFSVFHIWNCQRFSGIFSWIPIANLYAKEKRLWIWTKIDVLVCVGYSSANFKHDSCSCMDFIIIIKSGFSPE